MFERLPSSRFPFRDVALSSLVIAVWLWTERNSGDARIAVSIPHACDRTWTAHSSGAGTRPSLDNSPRDQALHLRGDSREYLRNILVALLASPSCSARGSPSITAAAQRASPATDHQPGTIAWSCSASRRSTGSAAWSRVTAMAKQAQKRTTGAPSSSACSSGPCTRRRTAGANSARLASASITTPRTSASSLRSFTFPSKTSDGGDCLADLSVLRGQPDLFGEAASSPTAWRVIESVTPERLGILRQARRQA